MPQRTCPHGLKSMAPGAGRWSRDSGGAPATKGFARGLRPGRGVIEGLGAAGPEGAFEEEGVEADEAGAEIAR